MSAYLQQMITFMLIFAAALWLTRRWLVRRKRTSCSHCHVTRSHSREFMPKKSGIRSPKLHILSHP